MTEKTVTILCLLIALSGCGAMRSAHESLQSQNFQTPMVDVNDVRALFAGDSITMRWNTASEQRNTGISGATAEIVGARFAREIQLGKPRYVHIMAGTNNIFGLGKWDQTTIDVIDRMVVAARARRIPTIVGTIPPMSEILYPSLAAQVAPYNAAVVASVKPLGATIADYYSALILSDGVQNAALFNADGVHVNDAGYAVMDKVLHQALRQAFRAERSERRAEIAAKYTPEQRQAWRAAHPRTHHHYTPEQRAAWRASHPHPMATSH